jgi:hypothetical protein
LSGFERRYATLVAILGADDPDATLYAAVIHNFGAIYNGQKTGQ